MSLLTEHDRENAIYLGDGLYMLDHGFQVELFASDGMFKNNMVFLDEHVLAMFLERLNQRKINED